MRYALSAIVKDVYGSKAIVTLKRNHVTMTTHDVTCSFCGYDTTKVTKLISGNDAMICNNCVDLCYSILWPEQHAAVDKSKITPAVTALPAGSDITPEKIYDHLCQYVVGQDYAKKVLSVLVSNHYKRIKTPTIDGTDIEKSNALMIGPSGSGKTLLASSVAKFLDVPCVIIDATSITEAGYVGEDVESILTKLLQSANGDVKKAEQGIVFIDECDKKAKKAGGNGGRDVSGEGVQQALLKLIEGTEISVPTTASKKSADYVKMNTKNILFIVGGAFVGIQDVILKKMNKDASIGFGSISKIEKDSITEEEIIKQIDHNSLESFGLIPELLGRLPVIVPLTKLTVNQLKSILTEPKNAIIKQFQAIFKLSGIELEVSDEALTMLADNAIKDNTGARSLRGALEKMLVDVQFSLPKHKLDGVSKVLISTENQNFKISTK